MDLETKDRRSHISVPKSMNFKDRLKLDLDMQR